MIGCSFRKAQPSKTLPSYELTCQSGEFIKYTAYPVLVREVKSPSEVMDVNVICVGGMVHPTSFRTDSVKNLTVTPNGDKCVITLECNGISVGSFEMNPVLTIPAYTIESDESDFVLDKEYALTVRRVTAPIRQTQIEVVCSGGFVSPAYLVDEGEGIPLEDANSKILVTPTEKTCTITLKVTLAGITYSVGKYSLKAINSL